VPSRGVEKSTGVSVRSVARSYGTGSHRVSEIGGVSVGHRATRTYVRLAFDSEMIEGRFLGTVRTAGRCWISPV
jgi:hypothetical protein